MCKRDQGLGFIVVHALRHSRLPGGQGLDTDFWVEAALRASLCNEGRSQECSLPRVPNAVCKCHPIAGRKKGRLLVNSIIGKVYSFFTQFLFLKFAYKTSPGFLPPPAPGMPPRESARRWGLEQLLTLHSEGCGEKLSLPPPTVSSHTAHRPHTPSEA